MSSLEEAVCEVRQRVTRIESRICRIADFLGARVGTPDKELRVVQSADMYVDIETPVLDVTLSEIIQFLTAEGMTGKVANVHFNGRRIASVTP